MVLVMVGILLALQVNNWNEDRKLTLIEKEILLEIQSDLIETLEDDLNEDLEGHLAILLSTHVVKKALVFNLPYQDSLRRHILRCFDDTRTYYKAGGYQSMLSRGVEIISNDSLRTAITNLYQLDFTRLDESAQEYLHKKELWPFKSMHFRLSPEIRRKYNPLLSLPDTVVRYEQQLISYEALRQDNQFLMELDNSMSFRLRKIRRCRFTIRSIKRILDILEQELN